MCQSADGPSRTGRDAAPAPAHAGSGDELPGIVTEVTPGGGVNWKAQTSLAWMTSLACSGPASSPMRAMLVPDVDDSIPDVGVMTNQLSGRTGIFDPKKPIEYT